MLAWDRNIYLSPSFPARKIVCLGLNYRGHVEETNNPLPEEPIYFEKASSAIIAHNQPVTYPPDLWRIDPEVELAVLIGKRGHRVKESEAEKYIAGYTILNDVTARDMQQKDIKKSLPWYRSKSLDTFCPIGPWIVAADEIDPLEALSIRLRVNGEVRQDSSTERLLFKIPSLIATLSEIIALDPGDVISTGTPAGIAPIYPGDAMEGEIEKIGILRNPVKKSG